MKMNHKKTTAVFAVIIVCLSVVVYLNCNHTEKGIEKYNEKISTDEELMTFSLDELGKYEEINFQSTKKGGILFSSYGSMFIAKYNSEEFIKQKNVIDNLKYQADPIIFDKTKYALPETEFQVGNWKFRVLCSKSANYTIPKNIDLIGLNEKHNKISYLTFYDQDIDYLCEIDNADGYMEKFVKKYFNYNFYKE